MKTSSFVQKTLLVIVGCTIITLAIYNISKQKSQTDTSANLNTVPILNNAENITETNSQMKKGASVVWGQDHGKQLGDVPLPPNTVDIALGTDFSVALLSDGQVMTWGSNDAGQLGRPTKNNQDDGTPTLVPGLTNIKSISATNKHTLALDTDGNVYAWGTNFTGQIGNGTNDDVFKPLKINTKKAIKIAAGYKFSMMIDTNNDVYVWGASCSKETQKKALALLNSLGSNINAIQGGYYDGASAGDGTYDHGEDCLNEPVVGIQSKTPKKLEGISNVKEISAGYGHALLITKDGSVWSFGCNLYGQLGRAEFDNVVPNATPLKIDGIHDAVAISAGFRTSFILDKDGKAYYWGINAKVDPATGSTFNFSTPFPLPPPLPGMKIQAISSGRDFSVLIADGKAYGFGNDQYNIISKANESYIATPITIEKLGGIKPFKLVAGGTHAAALFEKN